MILKCSFKVITTEYIYIGRRPVGLEVFIGAIARLMDGQLNKATVVDIGMNFITDFITKYFIVSLPKSYSGCGTGNYAAALSPFVGQITGVEYNSGMLEQAKMKMAHLSNVKFIQGDATKIPLPDGVCDVVTCTQVRYKIIWFSYTLLLLICPLHS